MEAIFFLLVIVMVFIVARKWVDEHEHKEPSAPQGDADTQDAVPTQARGR